MIDVVDDFLTKEELDFVVEYCVDAPYYYGEADNPDTPPTGLVHNVWFDNMNEDEASKYDEDAMERKPERKKKNDEFSKAKRKV